MHVTKEPSHVRTALRRNHVRTTATVVSVLALLALASACGSSSASPFDAAGSAAATRGAHSIDQILADAPVAPDAKITGAIKAIQERGELTVGGRETGALFSLKDPTTGKLTGFDAVLSQLLAKYILGAPKTKLVVVDSTTRELMLQNKTVDVVFATYTITPERAKLIAFAGPYFESGQRIAVRTGDTGVKGVGDLAEKTVTTQTNSTSVLDLATLAPTAKPLLFTTNDECILALTQERADAYVTDYSLLLGAALRNPDIKVVGSPLTQDPYGIGLPLDQPELKALVNDWLEQLEKSGLWERLWNQTIGSVVDGDAPTPPLIGSAAGS